MTTSRRPLKRSALGKRRESRSPARRLPSLSLPLPLGAHHVVRLLDERGDHAIARAAIRARATGPRDVPRRLGAGGYRGLDVSLGDAAAEADDHEPVGVATRTGLGVRRPKRRRLTTST